MDLWNYVGYWGIGSFENDAVWTWVHGFCQEANLSNVTGKIDWVIQNAGEEFVGTQECQLALGAAEVVAAWRGHPAPDFPDELATWVRQQSNPPPVPVVELARRVVVLIGKQSDLRDFWEEEGQLYEWLESVADLEQRLSM